LYKTLKESVAKLGVEWTNLD